MEPAGLRKPAVTVSRKKVPGCPTGRLRQVRIQPPLVWRELHLPAAVWTVRRFSVSTMTIVSAPQARSVLRAAAHARAARPNALLLHADRSCSLFVKQHKREKEDPAYRRGLLFIMATSQSPGLSEISATAFWHLRRFEDGFSICFFTDGLL